MAPSDVIPRVGDKTPRWPVWAAFVLVGAGACAPERGPVLADLVEVKPRIPGIVVELRLAGEDNFLKRRIYEAAHCLLRRTTVEKLALVQGELEQHGLGLKLWDAYRPLSAHRRMWALMPDVRYLDDPGLDPRRCRGCVVDATLVDAAGAELPMGAGHDPFDPLSRRAATNLPAQVRVNRALLRAVFVAAGFLPGARSWYRFEDADWRGHAILDVPLAGIPDARPAGPGVSTPEPEPHGADIRPEAGSPPSAPPP